MSGSGLGYRRLHVMLRREGVSVNHKRVWRVYREAGLAVRRRRRRRGVAVEREPLALPTAPNQVWSMDFVMDALVAGIDVSIQPRIWYAAVRCDRDAVLRQKRRTQRPSARRALAHPLELTMREHPCDRW